MWAVTVKFETEEAALAFMGMMIRFFPLLDSKMEEVYV